MGADWRTNSTLPNGIAPVLTIARCEGANKAGCQVQGGRDNVVYYDNLGNNDPMDLLRLILSGWSHFKPGYGFGDMAETSRDMMNTKEQA